MASNRNPIDLGILLALSYQSFVEQLRAHLAQEGFDDLGRHDGFVLRGLSRTPMTTSRIASLLHISKQAGAQVVNDMERRGYVEGHPDPTDGRARLLHLAPRGRNALVAARTFHRRHEETLEGMIGKEHVAILRTALYMIARRDGTQEPDTLTPYM